MPLSKIKAEFTNTYVAFGQGTGKLGSRPDIDDLAIIAHESGDPTIKKLFEVLPDLDALLKVKGAPAMELAREKLKKSSKK